MLIHNAVVVTWGKQNAVLNDYAVWIQDGKIADMGPSDELQKRYAGAEAWDAGGQLLMPGNICAHTHFYVHSRAGWPSPAAPQRIFRRSWKNYGGRWINLCMRKMCAIRLSLPGGCHPPRHNNTC